MRFLNKIQMDEERNLLIFMHNSIQKVIPISEDLKRGFNYEHLIYDKNTKTMTYYNKSVCFTDFKFMSDASFAKTVYAD
jgi:hypothetical protein